MAHAKVYCAAILTIMIAFMPFASAAEYKDKATIKKVQETLNARGYDCGTPDGISGKKTKEAICAFQKEKWLEVTGAVDDRLWNALELYESKEAQIPSDPRMPAFDREFFRKNSRVWAGCVFYEAMLKLTDAGVLEADPLKGVYPLKKNLKGTFPLVFKDKRAGKKLTSSGFKLRPGKIMICRENVGDFEPDEELKGLPRWDLYQVCTVANPSIGDMISMKNPAAAYQKRSAPPKLGYPGIDDRPSGNKLDATVVTSRLATKIDECDYVIAMGGYKSLVDEKYYSGGANRYGRTMIVFVIDAREMACVHIECVSTDLPGHIATDNVGDIKFGMAEVYVAKLLAGE
ncbi:MAG: peptidoglycan-binding domain-containing protein [Christensenellales bacterium]|jgi:hypothetical protein